MTSQLYVLDETGVTGHWQLSHTLCYPDFSVSQTMITCQVCTCQIEVWDVTCQYFLAFYFGFGISFNVTISVKYRLNQSSSDTPTLVRNI